MKITSREHPHEHPRSRQGIFATWGLFVLLFSSPLFSQPFRETKLVAPDGAAFDQFGASVAISGDWAAVGAPGRDDQGSASGAVYMFRKKGDGWKFSQKLLASDGAAGYGFNRVSFFGQYLAVGASGAMQDGIRSGAVYIFKLIDTTWIEMRKIGPSPATHQSWFGFDISLDRDYVLVGAYHDREAGVQTGAAYVFARNGEDWIQEARLLAPDRKEMHWFGYWVSLWDSFAFVGAPYDSNRNGEFAGAGYLFQRNGSIWSEGMKFIAKNGLPHDLAATVAIHHQCAILGAPVSLFASRPGTAYAFRAESTSWTQHQTIAASDGIDRNSFGGYVSLDHDVLVVGAPHDTAKGVGAGAAYLFALKDSSWIEKHKFVASDAAPGANFGRCSISDSTIIIGALNARVDGVTLRGAVYIYEPGVVGVIQNEPAPTQLQLYQNFPNPFNPITEIRWQTPDARWVTLRVYDLLGREVATLVNEMKIAGEYSVVFDAGRLASGVYYYRLMAEKLQKTRTMILLR